ncbi:unnamed protein product [Moneuplotes crassus]|uniref:RING-type domain-containing protein n=1 Tax=Euplotes crassus TaxID=5936 RepID=A0AAD1XRW1_EUPCR|nr:unnamed protein product [Moneuplotes crassus]
MWKFLVVLTIGIFLLFTIIKLLLDSQALEGDLILYDKVAINLMVITSLLDLSLGVNIMVIVIAQCTRDKTIRDSTIEFSIANMIILCVFQLLCVIYYTVYAQAMKPNISTLLGMICIISACILILGITILCIHYCTHKKLSDSDNFAKKTRDGPKGRRSLEKQLENIIRSLPTIIYQEYHDLKTQQCNICEEIFSHGESLKVYPKCYHIFHHECIKEWYKKRQSCPIDGNKITEGDVDRMDNIENKITKGKK